LFTRARQRNFYAGELDDERFERRHRWLCAAQARPISDVRGSAGYRQRMVKVCTQRGLRAGAGKGKEREGMPENPVLLWGKKLGTIPRLDNRCIINGHDAIITRINGKEYHYPAGSTKRCCACCAKMRG
jgi:hypothetical protein